MNVQGRGGLSWPPLNSRRAMPTADRLRANVSRLQVMSFTWMFMLHMPIVVPFLKVHGLGLSAVYQLQAIFALAVVVLEVPSGYVSDLLGRRGCLLVAGLVHGLAFTMFAVAETLAGFAAFQLLAAVGVSLYSGTDVALMYDSLEALDDVEGRRRVLGRRLLWMQSGETVAALVASILLFDSLQTVAWANAIVGWAPFFVALTLVEVPRPLLDRKSHLENVRIITRTLWNSSTLLRAILLNLVVYGLATYMAVWAFQGFWEEAGVPVAWFGVLWAAYNLTVALVGRVGHSIEDALGTPAVVGLIGALPVVGWIGLALGGLEVGNPRVWVTVGIIAGFSFQVGRGLTQTVIKDALNVRVGPEMRATANSVASLGVRLGFAVLGPGLGFLVDGYGYPRAFGAAAILFLVLMLTINRFLVRELASGPAGGAGPAKA